MAKREIEAEATDEELVETGVPTVGERLRAAREEKKLSLEDIAAQTRIPLRHLESIETADWDDLPAPTYTVGFAKSYASAVGLDRTEIGEQLREEMGGQRFAAPQTEVFEPADPARTMPKWLVFGAIAAVILLIVLMSWLNRRSLDQTDAPAAHAAADRARSHRQRRRAAGQPVAAAGPGRADRHRAGVDPGHRPGRRRCSRASLRPARPIAVPPSAVAPLLKAGKPEALQIKVGTALAPPVGPPATVVSNVSLKPADLMRARARPQSAPPTAPPASRLPRSTPSPPDKFHRRIHLRESRARAHMA